MTLKELVVVVIVGIIVIAVVMALLPCMPHDGRTRSETACRGNLYHIGASLQAYLGANGYKWPWFANVKSDWSAVPTGRNRGRAPGEDPGDRSITSLMFLLVRDEQPEGMFICGSTDDVKDPNIFDPNTGLTEDEELEYYWDFSSARNVSYSWQAPVKSEDGKFVNGINAGPKETVIVADKTPAVVPALKWDNTQWRPDLPDEQIRAHMSGNHDGKMVNVLRADMSTDKIERPDAGAGQDMIYTASGDRGGGSRSATSVNIADHLSVADSFLIGPVAADPNAPSR